MIDTEIATKLDIEKIYFSFDGSKTLKVAVIKKEKITSPEDAANKVKLFVIGESDSASKKFSYGELDKILGNANIVQNNHVRQAIDKGKLGVKLVEITKKKDAKGKTAGISVEVKSDNLDQGTSTAHEFKEIKKGLWSNPESDIAELTNSDKKEVKKSLNKVLKKIGEVHSGYGGEFKEERLFIRDGSLTYAKEAREAAHHGFIAGALVNFRYRHNLRVYLEQFAGRGYADIVLVPRGKDRSLNAIPIIIEMKAATKAELKEGKIGEKSGTTPTAALKQAEDYTKGFQPNVMRVLTTANDILCVGVNLDHSSPISDIMDKSRNQEITPLFNDIMESIDKLHTGAVSQKEALKVKAEKQIKNNIERIYHTFPGTGEKGDNHYFSRFLLGQSVLLNEVKGLNSDFEKQVFIYGENIPTESRSEGKERDVPQREAAKKGGEKSAVSSKLDQSHGVTTMVFIPEDDKKSVYVMNIVETNGRTEVLKKGIPLDQLKQKVGNRKIVELDLNFNINEKSNFKKYFSMEVSEPISLDQYNNKKTDKFKGSFENVPYPSELKETFDEVLKSQHIDQSASEAPDPEKLKETLNKALDKYKELLAKVGEGVSPFKSLIEKEAHFQAVLHGLFSHYSDIKLGDSPENRALVLTEFQTGKGKRVDMLVHGVKFEDRGSNAKEYIPIGLELKGPREGKEADALKKEANKQITDEYKEGVTYKTLTDGDKVACVGVVFDKKAGNANSLIQLSNEEKFTPVKVVHSSIMQIGQQPPRKKVNLNSCVRPGGRSKRSVNSCLFSKDDVERFSKGKVDENNVDKIIIDSEKFLTYVKNSQDEAKNAQLVEFVGDKNIEGDRKYLLDKVVGDQGYERYVQNERIKDLRGDISQQDSSLIKNPKLKGRLMSAAGGIQLIRGIHGAIVSCQDGVTTDCGLNLGGIGWSFVSQPIENAMVKITPKIVTSAEKVVGKIPGVLGKQTKFAVQVAGVKFGSKIAGGAAGAITGVFDIVDIGMSANNLVDCKKRENSDNPCGEKEIRDNIATISFSTVSFVSGVALTALSMPGVGIAAGVALMVASGVYSGVSNIVEYEKKYDTTHGENWRIFWHTFAFQPIPEDVQHLAARKEMVNRLTKEAWKTLNDTPDNVVAYAFGLGRVSGNILHYH